MPSLSLNKMLGSLRFASKQLKMPLDWDLGTSPETDALYVQSLPPVKRVPRPPKVVPPLFQPHRANLQPHADMCDTLGQFYKDLIDIACDGVTFGMDQWRLQAKFGVMQIIAASVIGTPGCLVSPPITTENLIKQSPSYAALLPSQKPYYDAVAEGVGAAVDRWAKGVTIPGLPLYPAYVMQPPGAAVPAPCVPQKLIACISPGMMPLITPPLLKEQMTLPWKRIKKVSKLSDSDDAYFEAMSTVCSIGFIDWLAKQPVNSIVGTGAVASPTGGPVAGMTLPTPGHFVA